MTKSKRTLTAHLADRRNLAVLFLVLLLGSVLIYRGVRTDAREAAAQEFARLNDSRQTPPAPPEGFVRLDLSPGLTRGEGQTNRVRLPKGAAGLRLRLDLPPGVPETFRARLRDPEDETRFYTADDLRPVGGEDARAVVLHVPARLLPPGDHQVRLGGRNLEGDFEDVGTYHFRVTGD
ncbi:MAG TPA: hypothetical protein VGV38_11215 [Pyrinomonadaceae bacterium]|nr:hypothetical protein [Pyrinomonadaceae bacterium]